MEEEWIVGREEEKGMERKKLEIGGVMIMEEDVIIVMGEGWMEYMLGFEKGIELGLGILIVGDIVKIEMDEIGVKEVKEIVKR